MPELGGGGGGGNLGNARKKSIFLCEVFPKIGDLVLEKAVAIFYRLTFKSRKAAHLITLSKQRIPDILADCLVLPVLV